MPTSATEVSAIGDPYHGAGLSPGALTAVARAVTLVASDLAAAEHRLIGLLQSDVAEIPEVASHLALAGGKRLRPLLALLGAAAASYTDEARITVAAVGELLHTATLLHDDVVDSGEFRRGRPAARIVYGNGLAVLTGDFCLSAGLVAIADTGQPRAFRTLAETVMRMSEGEVAQLSCAGTIPDRARYYDIVDRKTATLIAWCASVGGLVAPAACEALLHFGTELGYAFQIADDVLDVLPRRGRGPGLVGKEPGQDLRDGKITLPIALACEEDPALARDVSDALAAGPPLRPEILAEILGRVLATGAATRARDIAAHHAASACTALQALPSTEARDALVDIAGYVVERDR